MTTYHGLIRTQERTGFNMKSSVRFIANAVERGKTAETFTKRDRNYLRRQETKEGTRALTYNLYCFILNDENCCVTMYPVPKWFGKKKFYDGKREIKNTKKYIRYNNLLEEF